MCVCTQNFQQNREFGYLGGVPYTLSPPNVLSMSLSFAYCLSDVVIRDSVYPYFCQKETQLQSAFFITLCP